MAVKGAEGTMDTTNEKIPAESRTIFGMNKEQLDFVSALIALLLKVSTGLGGMIPVIYAAKEGFFYDVSSFAAVAVLLVVLLTFSFLAGSGLAYGAVSSIWIAQLCIWAAERFRKGGPPRRLWLFRIKTSGPVFVRAVCYMNYLSFGMISKNI
jgi:hypothetical protein